MSSKISPEDPQAKVNENSGIRERPVKQVTRQRTNNVIAKVKDPGINTDWAVDKEIDLWVKMKLREWDKDANGSFTQEEMEVAMEDLRETEAELAGMKWRFIGLFGFIFLFLAFMTGCCAIAMSLTKETSVASAAEMRAPNPKSKKPKLTELVSTAQSRGNLTFLNLLSFDTTTDQWLLDEAQLREMDKVSFTDSSGAFYNIEVAELIRQDSGATGTDDKLEILGATGVRIRVWESVGEMEVSFPNQAMWSKVTQTGGRLLSVRDGDDNLEDEEGNYKGKSPLPPEWEEEQGPSRRLGKGGTVFVYAGGGGGYGGHHTHVHHHNNGGGGGGCNGWCSVPYGSNDNCRVYCGERQCYSWGSQTYQCRGAAVRTFFGPGWFFQAIAAMLLIGRACQDSA